MTSCTCGEIFIGTSLGNIFHKIGIIEKNVQKPRSGQFQSPKEGNVGRRRGEFSKFVFSAKTKATGTKLGTHVGHNHRYAPKIFGPSRNMYMTTLIKNPLPLPLSFLGELLHPEP